MEEISIKVPAAIATEKEINKKAVSLVETRIDINFLTIYWKSYIPYYLHLQKYMYQ